MLARPTVWYLRLMGVRLTPLPTQQKREASCQLEQQRQHHRQHRVRQLSCPNTVPSKPDAKGRRPREVCHKLLHRLSDPTRHDL